MEPRVLLGELRALADSMPDFAAFLPWSRVHHEWVAKTTALIGTWNADEGDRVRKRIREDFGSFVASYHQTAISKLLATLHSAIADIEISEVARQGDQMFGPGAVYDFFKALNDLISSATQFVLVVDPYLDAEVFDTYLAAAPESVAIRLLTRKRPTNLKAALTTFVAQTGRNIESRLSELIHDRVIFVDGRSCWVLGQSIKDAAKTKPTYLAPLDSDTASAKLAVYEDIWTNAAAI